MMEHQFTVVLARSLNLKDKDLLEPECILHKIIVLEDLVIIGHWIIAPKVRSIIIPRRMIHDVLWYACCVSCCLKHTHTHKLAHFLLNPSIYLQHHKKSWSSSTSMSNLVQQNADTSFWTRQQPWQGGWACDSWQPLEEPWRHKCKTWGRWYPMDSFQIDHPDVGWK